VELRGLTLEQHGTVRDAEQQLAQRRVGLERREPELMGGAIGELERERRPGVDRVVAVADLEVAEPVRELAGLSEYRSDLTVPRVPPTSQRVPRGKSTRSIVYSPLLISTRILRSG
jgi:hypothetical protein